MKILIYLFILSWVNQLAHALETDQFLVWGKELQDSSTELNAYFNQNFKKAVELINANPELVKKSCEEATVDVLKQYHAFWWGERLENWILENDTIQKIPDFKNNTRMEAIHQTIYRDVFKFRFKIIGYNIRMGEVNLGVDKMGHFSSVGLSYYQLMLEEARKLNVPVESILPELKKYETQKGQFPVSNPQIEAVNKAIAWGIHMEKWMWGYAVSDTFSYADLEANYQGMLFSLNFCQGEHPYMKKENGVFVVNAERPIDLREYINPLFDETYNPSHYQRKIYHTIKPYLKQYCDLKNSDAVKELFKSYDQLVEKNGQSYSSQYLDFLRHTHPSMSSKKYYLNDPVRSKQTLNFICRE